MSDNLNKPRHVAYNLVYDVDTLSWIPQEASGGASPGSGGDVNVTNSSLAVTGPVTDTQLRAADIKVTLDGEAVTGTFWQATQPVSIAAAVSVTDGAGSLTVDGTVAATQSGTWTVQPGNTANTTAWKVDGSAVTQPISAASLPLPTNAATSALQTQPGVDIGDVTINNATGGSAVNIQDGGNTITVDGTVSVNLNAGTNNIGDVDVLTIPAVTNAGVFAVQVDGSALTALQLIDNFISGARGLVTEDNSAAALTALQTIDNFISGSRGLVTEDNSAAILVELSAKTEPADQQHTIVDEMPALTGEVNESPSAGLATGDIVNLSVTTDGRLRVSSLPAFTYIELFDNGTPLFDIPELTATTSPWDVGSSSPWS